MITQAEAVAAGEESLAPWITGRTSLQKVVNPATNETIVKKLELIADLSVISSSFLTIVRLVAGFRTFC